MEGYILFTYEETIPHRKRDFGTFNKAGKLTYPKMTSVLIHVHLMMVHLD